MAAQPLNILKYLGLPLLVLLFLLVCKIKKLFAFKDLVVIVPIMMYLPLFFVAFKGWLAVRYLSPIIPLVAVLVSKLFIPGTPSMANKWLRQLVLFLCLIQFVFTLGFVYLNRQVTPQEREAINYIKENTPPDVKNVDSR